MPSQPVTDRLVMSTVALVIAGAVVAAAMLTSGRSSSPGAGVGVIALTAVGDGGLN